MSCFPLLTRIKNAKVVDYEVRRVIPVSCSLFSPGSSRSDTLGTSVETIVCAGDWVRMGDEGKTWCKGLLQKEPPYVCASGSRKLPVRRTLLEAESTEEQQHPCDPIRADEPQVS